MIGISFCISIGSVAKGSFSFLTCRWQQSELTYLAKMQVVFPSLTINLIDKKYNIKGGKGRSLGEYHQVRKIIHELYKKKSS